MALSQIPNPYAVNWRDFVDTLVGFNPTLSPNISPDESWRDVAQRLIEFAQDAPSPEPFADWREWAAALKQAYPN